MIKTLFLDVDGTLLSFDTHRVPSSAVDALNELHRKGVQLVIATGRSAANLSEISSIPYDGVVGLNGSECTLRSGKVLVRRTFSRRQFEQVLSVARRYDFAVCMESSEGIYVDRITPRVEQLARMVNQPLPEVRSLEEVFALTPCPQMCIYTDEATERAAMAELSGLISSRWCEVFADVNLAGVDKGTGVRAYAKAMGLNLAETMAIGDGGNDIPMLQTAGIGIAMGGAAERVQAAAYYVTDTVERDGLVKAFRRFGLL